MKNRKLKGMVVLMFLTTGTLLLYSCKGKPTKDHLQGDQAPSMSEEMSHKNHNTMPNAHKETERGEKIKYACPMHAEVTSDKPGHCPICNMDLVPLGKLEKEGHSQNATQESMLMERDETHQDHAMAKTERTPLYHCPMHPTFTSDKPGECGICGMTLVPVELGIQRESQVEGRAVVKIPERRQQLIGVKIGSVQKRPMIQSLRTVGRVAYDPELYRAQEEYLASLSSYEKVKNSSIPETVERAKSLVESSELRLRLLGLSNRQIRELAKRRGPDTSLLISGGRSGTVWLYADVYEYELSAVKVGQEIEATTISYPGELFHGTVKAIDSVINPKSRSARVRAEVRNREGMLKPDMYMNAVIKIDQGEHLTVPESAVMDTGARRVVFVAEGDGYFEPREVLLGEKSEDYYQVKSGLFAGDKVVTSGNFLIDSESKLKASLSALAGGHHHP